MRAGAGCTAVGVDGKHMGRASEGADGYPATVLAETHVLDLDKDRTGSGVREGCRRVKQGMYRMHKIIHFTHFGGFQNPSLYFHVYTERQLM